MRRAFNLAFDFEDINRTLFFGQYERVDSYLPRPRTRRRPACPKGQELAILESLRDKVPGKSLHDALPNPVGGTRRGDARQSARGRPAPARGRLGVEGPPARRMPRARPFTVEFLSDSPNDERIFLPYKAALERLGIVVTVRTVDDVQHVNRLRSFDFDVVIVGLGAVDLARQRAARILGFGAADRPGSRNLAGIKDPGVDALIEQGDLRQGPRPSWSPRRGRSTGFCSRTTTWCRNGPHWLPAHRALEPLQPPRDDAAIRRLRLPDRVVVRSGQGRTRPEHRDDQIRRADIVLAGTAAAAALAGLPRFVVAQEGETETHGLSSLRRPEIRRRTSSISTTSTRRRRRAARWRSRSSRGSATRTSTPSTPSTSSS